MSEFFGDDESFNQYVTIDAKECRSIHWINKSFEKGNMNDVAQEIIAKLSQKNIETIQVIKNTNYIGVIAINLDKVWKCMYDFSERFKTTPENLLLIEENDENKPARVVSNTIEKTIHHNYEVPYIFPLNWKVNKEPDSLVLPSIDENDISRCYKLYKPIKILSTSDLIRTGMEYELAYQ